MNQGSVAQNNATRPSHFTSARGLNASSPTYTSLAACASNAAARSIESAIANESIVRGAAWTTTTHMNSTTLILVMENEQNLGTPSETHHALITRAGARGVP